MVGRFAISKSGHDKGTIYVIIKEEADFVFLVDGKLKLVEKPKIKNKKHIQIIKKLPDNITGMLKNKEDYQNENIKRAIKLYGQSNNE